MVTIMGNGMGKYDFSNLDISFCEFDKIVCDKNFIDSGSNVLKLGFKDAKEYILDHFDDENILYVVSGSPLFYSAGILIANKLPKNSVKIIDNESSKKYLLKKLFISEQSCGVFSLHGRTLVDLEVLLVQKYTFILCDDKTIDRLKEALSFVKDQIKITIGYKLDYEDEEIKEIDIFDDFSFDLTFPYVLLIDREYEHKSPICDDLEFETQRGMITKKYKRHLSLQNLDLLPNQLLWDIGAGSGSCGIEAFKRYRVSTVFFEKNPLRSDFILKNLHNHHVLNTKLLIGEAQNLFETLSDDPERIFVGGGGVKVIEKLPYLYERLKESGVMLINAITLSHLSKMIEILNSNSIKYEVHSISLTTYKGKLDLVEPERQLFQIKVIK
jgi:precorrin-6Y C5,15-methyltransferase (decarboxylating)